MSKHLCGFRSHTAYAMDSIRSEGWKVRRIAADVWKVSDRRPHRWEYQHGRRHFTFNRAGLLDFAGLDGTEELGRYPYARGKIRVLSAIHIDDADLPF